MITLTLWRSLGSMVFDLSAKVGTMPMQGDFFGRPDRTTIRIHEQMVLHGVKTDQKTNKPALEPAFYIIQTLKTF